MEIITIVLVAITLILSVINIIILIKNKSNKINNTNDFEKIIRFLETENAKINTKFDAIVSQLNEKTNNLSNQIRDFTKDENERHIKIINTLTNSSDKQSLSLKNSVKELTESNERKLESLRETVESKLKSQNDSITNSLNSISEKNEKKLEQMRATVDEKLTETLNKRISTSFEQVSKQLSDVYKSLGEMKELSSGVTDNVKGLNRVLTNVKTRGTWAEVQLGNILDETIPTMYDRNVKTNPKYNGQVEFAVKIPNSEDKSIMYLPIDSKFPMEDYARIQKAAEEGNLEELISAKKALETRVLSEGKMIKEYISEPNTTPFAIMYLATEGLYAEIMQSQNAIAEKLQKEGILVAGPSTITAIMNSLSLGFRYMAINQKAKDVWEILGAIKQQYEKFSGLIAKAKKEIDRAGKTLEDTDKRNELIVKALKNVEDLELKESNEILGLDDEIEDDF